ncbi:uncharacterized protein LOC143920208 [Arctopsyche grandis]|uniref:uncharacterized protein LOC143920208 n=1 Tax=Arctopsyche grandis TaxID=121162 RepID=UPI00406D7A37
METLGLGRAALPAFISESKWSVRLFVPENVRLYVPKQWRSKRIVEDAVSDLPSIRRYLDQIRSFWDERWLRVDLLNHPINTVKRLWPFIWILHPPLRNNTINTCIRCIMFLARKAHWGYLSLGPGRTAQLANNLVDATCRSEVAKLPIPYTLYGFTFHRAAPL